MATPSAPKLESNQPELLTLLGQRTSVDYDTANWCRCRWSGKMYVRNPLADALVTSICNPCTGQDHPLPWGQSPKYGATEP